MKPIIGISSSMVKISEFSEGVYVHQDYSDTVRDCGGLPIVLPLTDPKTYLEMLELCDGVIFSGGEDVDPQYYGQDPHQQLGMIRTERDTAELAAIRHTLHSRKPLFAICRGVQILNVAYGGTLYQDLPSQLPNAMQHLQKAPRKLDTHTVAVEENSYLHQILGETEIRVNSLHHQAIWEIGEGLSVTARAADGVIEAVEDTSCPFLIGVQWHPESMAGRDPLMKGLFQEFIKQSLHYRLNTANKLDKEEQHV